jgi:hypothetical protein
MENVNNEFLQSLRDHSTVWTLGSIAWLLSCVFVWKLELFALERNAASHYAKSNLRSLPKGPCDLAELKKLPWYAPEIGTKLNEMMQVLLEEYGSIPRYNQEAHIYRIVGCFPSVPEPC